MAQPRIVSGQVVDTIGAPVPLTRGAATVRVGCSIGIAMHPDHGSDADTLVERADRAMYRAKRERATATIYDESLESLVLAD